MRCRVVLAALVLVAGGIAPALAQPARPPESRARPLDELLPHVRNANPGTFYDAEGPYRGPDGRMHYRLKWLTPQGRMVWLDTDAATGRVLGVNRGAPPPRVQPLRRRFAPREPYPGRQFRQQRSAPPRILVPRGRGGDEGPRNLAPRGRGPRDDGPPRRHYNFQRDRRR